ncbi:MAG: hypothetical protein AB7S75_07770 [Desulfococcaceae bacterium]
MILRFFLLLFLALPVGTQAADYYYPTLEQALSAAMIQGFTGFSTDSDPFKCWDVSWDIHGGNHYSPTFDYSPVCLSEYELHGVFLDRYESYKFLKGLAGIVCGLLFIGAVIHNM